MQPHFFYAFAASVTILFKYNKTQTENKEYTKSVAISIRIENTNVQLIGILIQTYQKVISSLYVLKTADFFGLLVIVVLNRFMPSLCTD